MADWIGVTMLVIGVTGTALGAYWASRKPRDPGAEQAFKQKPHVVVLHEDDRSLLGQLRDAILGHRKAVEDHAEVVGKHRHAVGDNTAQRRRED